MARLEAAAREIYRKGHVPIVGLNLALPVALSLERTFWEQEVDFDQGRMVDMISLAATERCDAVLRVDGPSAGADAEVDLIRSLGKPVYLSPGEVPAQ